MSFEIERKFLVKNNAFKEVASHSFDIVQGFLSSDPNRLVRVRISDNQGYLTVKGVPDHSGTTRFEWEKPIELSEARQLLSLCEPGIIEKTRYIIGAWRPVIEVDVFHKQNSGLILAEIELSDENENFIKPEWIGKEVTGDKRYFNVFLTKHPYKTWN